MTETEHDTDLVVDGNGFASPSAADRRKYTADDSEPIGAAVVRAVAAAEGTDPLSFRERLYDVLDPDALENLVDAGGADFRIEFTFGSYDVLVTGRREVLVSEVPDFR